MGFLDWFRPERKEINHTTIRTSHQLAQFLYGKDFGWDLADYPNIAREAYQSNPIVARCIDEIVANAETVDWLAYRGDQELLTPSTHFLLKLIRLPNPSMTLSRMVGRMLFDLMLDGNIYVERVNYDGMRRGAMYLWLHRPDRVTPQPGVGPFPDRFEITVGDGSDRRTITVDQATGRSDLLHIRTHNPINDLKGSSPLRAAWRSVLIFNAQQRWAHNLLKNNARPSMALVGKDLELTEDQRAFLRDELETHYAGASNAGRPLIMEGNWGIEFFGMTPQEIDFVEAANQSARLIAGALGIPPQLLGIPGDNTYANVREARRALFEQTILPKLELIKNELNRWLELDEVYLDFNDDDIPAMLPKREMLFGMLEKSSFLTINEKREMVGFSPRPDGDVYNLAPPAEGGEEPGEEGQILESEEDTDRGRNQREDE